MQNYQRAVIVINSRVCRPVASRLVLLFGVTTELAALPAFHLTAGVTPHLFPYKKERPLLIPKGSGTRYPYGCRPCLGAPCVLICVNGAFPVK